MITNEQLQTERTTIRSELMDAQTRPIGTRPGAWSPGQVFEHILLTEQSVVALLRRMEQKAGQPVDRPAGGPWPVRDQFLEDFGAGVMEEPAFRGTDPDQAMDLSALQSLSETNGAALEELMLRADSSDLSSASFPHPLVGRMNFYEWLVFLVAHERLHVEHLRGDLT